MNVGCIANLGFYAGRVLRCTPELLVERLASEGQRVRTPAEKLLRALQVSTARALHIGHSVKQLAAGKLGRV